MILRQYRHRHPYIKKIYNNNNYLLHYLSIEFLILDVVDHINEPTVLTNYHTAR